MRVVTMTAKPSTTYQEQVELMKNRGCIILDEAACISFLQRVNYYRLTAYFLPFRRSDQSYLEGITFEQIKGIYDFDQKMRAFLFPIIEELEIFIRTHLTYYHSQEYGSLGYMEASAFNEKHRHEESKERLYKLIKDNSRLPFVRHHNNNYGGEFPLWVAMELFSMGSLSRFYSDLLSKDAKKIASIFNTHPSCLRSWLQCLTNLRNRCAHYGRLYFAKFVSEPKIPSGEQHASTRRLFTQIFMLKLLYFDKEKWNQVYLTQLSTLIEEYSPYINLDHIGFPTDWKDQLKK